MHRLFALILMFLWLLPMGVAAETLQVGVYQNPPLTMYDSDGQVSGLFPDLLERIAEEKGWQLEYITGSWSDCLSGLENGTIDVLPAIAFTPERAQLYDFTEQTILSNWGQIYLKKGTHAESILQLDGKTVAVKHRDVYFQGGHHDLSQLARNFNININYVELEGYREAFEALSSGTVDAALVNRIFGAQNYDKYEVVESSILLSPIEVRLAFSAGHLLFRDDVDAVLTSWKADHSSPYFQITNDK